MILLKAAYGRHYKNEREAWAHWNGGKDFLIVSGEDAGRYCSVRDEKHFDGIQIRWHMAERCLVIREDAE